MHHVRVVHQGHEYFAAACLEGPDLDAKIAEYHRTHLNMRVLFADDRNAVIVHSSDSGRELDSPESDFATKGWRSLYAQDPDDRRKPEQAGFIQQSNGAVALSKTELLIAAGEMTAFAVNLGRLSTYFAELLLHGDEDEAARKAFFNTEARRQRADFGLDVHVPARTALASARQAAAAVDQRVETELPGWLPDDGERAVMGLMLLSMVALEDYYRAQARGCGAHPQHRRRRSPNKGMEDDDATIAMSLALRGKTKPPMAWEAAVKQAAQELGKRTPSPEALQNLCARARQRSRSLRIRKSPA